MVGAAKLRWKCRGCLMKLLFWHKDDDAALASPDLEAMSVDELIEWKLVRQRQIQAIQEELRTAQVIYTRKVELWHAIEALKRVGLEGIVLEPGPAVLKAEGK